MDLRFPSTDSALFVGFDAIVLSSLACEVDCRASHGKHGGEDGGVLTVSSAGPGEEDCCASHEKHGGEDGGVLTVSSAGSGEEG